MKNKGMPFLYRETDQKAVVLAILRKQYYTTVKKLQ